MPKTIKILPIAMVPHKNRDFRTILDLSLNLKLNGTTILFVNDGTVPTTLQYLIQKLGRVIERMIALMATLLVNSSDFLFSKLDIKDRF